MSGADIGWLSVYRCSETDQETLLWSMNKDQGEEWKQVQINLMDSGNNEHTKVGGVNIHELFFIFSLWESMISARVTRVISVNPCQARMAERYEKRNGSIQSQ